MADGRIVAVVSDFGADSFYVGVMKSVVLAAAPQCRVVDLTHCVRPHEIAEASFILDTVFDFFARGTVFLVVVDPGVGGERDNLVVEVGGRYIVGPDNGIATEVIARCGGPACFVIDDALVEPYRISPRTGSTFLGRDVFAPAAAALAAGAAPAAIGSSAPSPPASLELPPVAAAAGRVSGPARYVDRFGNLLTGITAEHLRSAFGRSDPGRIAAAVDGIDLGALCAYYSERPAGELMAVLNSWDRVEISVREGRAADRFAGKDPLEVNVELWADTGR
jgi:S-adenosylmethionine hydrolase